MTRSDIVSDQFYKWSERREAEINLGVEKAAPSPPPRTAPADRHPPRLPHRALQTLRQTRMQMRQGPRPRSQVLPVRQLSPVAPPNGLCAAGILRSHQEAPGQLSARSRDPGGDLRDQSRTTPPARGALRNHDERNVFLAHRTHRSESGGRPPGQHARGLARRPTRLPEDRGGDR